MEGQVCAYLVEKDMVWEVAESICKLVFMDRVVHVHY